MSVDVLMIEQAAEERAQLLQVQMESIAAKLLESEQVVLSILYLVNKKAVQNLNRLV